MKNGLLYKILVGIGSTPLKKSRSALFCKFSAFSNQMCTKGVWYKIKLKYSLGLLIFCSGCADLMPFSIYLCKKIIFIKI